jgi:hypothetical protein
MSEHQETITQVLKRAVASFDKMDAYGKKLDDHRITLGVLLNDLRARVGAGEAGKGVKWWSWYGGHFENRSRRDAERVMRLASSDDPQAAADEERTKAREGMAAQRKKIATNVSRDSQPASAPEGYRHTEEEVAAGIARDVETEIAVWEEEGLDLDLIRELVLSKLKDGADREEKAEPPKRRGRPPGSKNKPKEAAPAEEPPEPAPATGAPAAPTTTAAGNGVDPEGSAKERGAYYDDDLSNPNHPLHRSAPEQPVQP